MSVRIKFRVIVRVIVRVRARVRFRVRFRVRVRVRVRTLTCLVLSCPVLPHLELESEYRVLHCDLPQ
jgi:hypothetical protein